MSNQTSERDNLIEWFISGDTGISSKAMAGHLSGVTVSGWHNIYTPSDPSDFNRCLMLLDKCPYLKPKIHKMAELSPDWQKIVKHWSEIERCFLDEAGLGWSKQRSAPKTYELMQRLKL